MHQLINNIPTVVWPLFAILLLSGLKARKANEVPLMMMFLMPIIFFGWSLISFFGKYGTHPLATSLWLICLGLGLLIGFSHMQTLDLKFDKKKKRVEIPGSWLPLLLSMSIFFAKFAAGMLSAMMPDLNGSAFFLGLELFYLS